MKIYIIEQLYEMVYEPLLPAFRSLKQAQALVLSRAGVTQWEAHNSHGCSWESVDGDGKYVIIELELREDA